MRCARGQQAMQQWGQGHDVSLPDNAGCKEETEWGCKGGLCVGLAVGCWAYNREPERLCLELLGKTEFPLIKSNGLKLCMGRFRLDVRKHFFSKRAVVHRHRMPRGGVESPCLEVFKQPVDVALRDVVLGHGGDGLAVGPHHLRGRFQP